MDLSKFEFYINPNKKYEKYVFTGWDDKHLTLRVWNEKEEIDLHFKNTLLPKGHPNQYEPILTMKFSEVNKLLNEIEKFALENGKQLYAQRMNAGKLIRYNCYLQYLPDDEETMNLIFNFKRNNRVIKFREKAMEHDFSDTLIEVDELIDYESGAFLVVQQKKGVEKLNGYVYRFPMHKGTMKFIFVSKAAMNKYKSEKFLSLFNVLKQTEFKGKEIIIPQIDRLIKTLFPYYKG